MSSTKVYRYSIVTYGPNALFDITWMVEDAVKKAQVRTGAAFVWSTGSTGAIVRLPPHVVEDFKKVLWDLLPVLGWLHPGNAYAHLRSTLIKTCYAIPVLEGKPLLNNTRVYFLENQSTYGRRRTIYVAVSAGSSTSQVR